MTMRSIGDDVTAHAWQFGECVAGVGAEKKTAFE